MLKKVSNKTDFIALEHRILDFWKENDTFNKLRRQNEGKPKWSFLDGPITANNPMGVHHAWGRSYKDVYQRYNAMTGHELRYQNGFDCQGLWVEVEVEKELGIKSKTDIEELGIEKFVQRCKDRVTKYSAIQTQQSIRLGYWMDWDNSYYTMADTNNYTIWAFLKKCYERGWIYKGHDVMPWCINCGAAMSQHEIATEGYKELTHTSVYIRFPLVDREKESLVVWTTTPWTLPANVAAAVHPELTYVKVKQKDEILYLAKSRLEAVKAKGAYEILEEMKGEQLIGLKYRGPFEELDAQQNVEHPVIAWDEVSEDDGTGIVHIAPGCGKEDFELSKVNELPAIAPLDEFGNYIDGFNWLSGQNVREVGEPIIQDLLKKGRLYRTEKITHRYPVCWRHGTELVFRLVDEWFINMDELRYQIMEVTKKIQWMPEYGKQLELDWLKNMQDWMISKKRFWGLALPIFECENCGNFEVLGSKEELKERAVEGWDQFEGKTPHRPFIDRVVITCSQCGEKVNRIPDVGNPWLDAGIVPYSTMKYMEDRSYWEKWFPADFITECFPGQFRNWFYAILTMSTVMENRPPFKTILGHALVKDEHGEDMHKSSGNAIWFEEAAEKMGVDIMRWLFMRSTPFNNINFGYGPGDEVRKNLVTLWNTYAFWTNYAILDGINPAELSFTKDRLGETDRWILARLQELVGTAHHTYKNYNVMAFIKETERFIGDLSNWYVRRNRRRFWRSEKDSDKQVAYWTLHKVLVTLLQLLAPVTPFITEEIYQNLVVNTQPDAPESIHLTSFPEVEEQFVDKTLVAEVDAVIYLVSAGRSLRQKSNLKVRQPLSEFVIRPTAGIKPETLLKYESHFLEELNVKTIKFIADDSALVEYVVKIDFKKLGPKYGKNVGKIQQLMNELPGAEVAQRVHQQLGVPVILNGTTITLEPDEIQLQTKSSANYVTLDNNGYLVGLNTEITEELRLEGMARDIIRQVQELRKVADFEMSDRIHLFYEANASIQTALDTHRDYIKTETLALDIVVGIPAEAETAEAKIGGEKLMFGVVKA